MNEPVFSRQEQGVVYLFSRYWQQIPEFRDKRVTTVQVRFPDASMTDTTTGASEAIEFEYNLSKFYKHAPKDLRKPGDLKRLAGYKALYIVYWDQDTDEKELRRRIRRHFTGKVVFVCVNRYFTPSIKPGPDRLLASWEFSRTKRFRETYSYTAIRRDAARLQRKGVLEPFKVRKGLYRVAGFNKRWSEFIECDHWRTIHFYTTGGFGDESVPSRLFVKPTGCKRFSGCFDIKYAFATRKGGKDLKDFWRKYYFYPFDDYYHDSICLVYSQFRELSYDQGVRLYRYLKGKRYWLRQTSELIKSEHRTVVDRIAGCR